MEESQNQVKLVLPGKRMAITKRLTIESVNLGDQREMDALVDQMFTAGLARVKAEGDKLRQKGLLDSQGNLVVKELPADMQEGADRDFGG